MTHRLLATLALVGFAWTGTAAAQVRGLPVIVSGVHGGIELAGDVGFPNDAAGGGTAYGITGRIGAGLFGASATLALYNPDGTDENTASVGGTANLQVLGGPLVPVSATFQAGIGYAKLPDTFLPSPDVSYLHVPLALGIAVSLPTPVLSVRPWVAPRLDIVRASFDGTSDTETNFGLSGGVELNTISGFGLHAAADWVAADGDEPVIVGIGAHYAFRVPGL